MPKSFPLHKAVESILTPLVRILLKNGVSYGTFADIAKEVFTRVAMMEFTLDNRKQSISRVSVLTGLTRKAVKAIVAKPVDAETSDAEVYNRATRVIAGWRRDVEFQDDTGRPAILPMHGPNGSFARLVKKYSGDMPVRAVLDELERNHSVRRQGDERVQLLVRAFLPNHNAGMNFHILGTDVAHLIATIGHNMTAEHGKRLFQRKVAYDNLPHEALAAFRDLSAERCQQLLEELDAILSRQDRDNHPEIEGTGRYAAGVGIYYFEEELDHES